MEEYVKKFRPKKIEDFAGKTQRGLGKAFQESVDRGDAFQKVMLLGDTGVGKTALAELFTTILLGDEYEEKMDVFSYPGVTYYNCGDKTGIDSMRQLTATFPYRGLYGDKKIVFFDEMHRLSKDAQESLLVALEQLPDHVYILSCTTEKDGIKETLLGRFKPLNIPAPSEQEFKKRASRIAKAEGYTISTAEFEMLLNDCGGSVRVFDDGLELLIKGFYTDKEKIEELTTMVAHLINNDPNRNIPKCYKDAQKVSDYYYLASGLVGYAIKAIAGWAEGDVFERSLLIIEVFGAGLNRQVKPRDAFYSAMTSYMRILRSK